MFVNKCQKDKGKHQMVEKSCQQCESISQNTKFCLLLSSAIFPKLVGSLQVRLMMIHVWVIFNIMILILKYNF